MTLQEAIKEVRKPTHYGVRIMLEAANNASRLCVRLRLKRGPAIWWPWHEIASGKVKPNANFSAIAFGLIGDNGNVTEIK